MVRTKQTARKNTGRGATQNSKFIYHIIYLEISVLLASWVGYKYMYMSLHIVFLEGKKMNPGMKQPHTPIPASILRVEVEQVDEVEVNIFACVSVKIGQNHTFS